MYVHFTWQRPLITFFFYHSIHVLEQLSKLTISTIFFATNLRRLRHLIFGNTQKTAFGYSWLHRRKRKFQKNGGSQSDTNKFIRSGSFFSRALNLLEFSGSLPHRDKTGKLRWSFIKPAISPCRYLLAPSLVVRSFQQLLRVGGSRGCKRFAVGARLKVSASLSSGCCFAPPRDWFRRITRNEGAQDPFFFVPVS